MRCCCGDGGERQRRDYDNDIFWRGNMQGLIIFS